MKQIYTLFLILILALCLGACGAPAAQPTQAVPAEAVGTPLPMLTEAAMPTPEPTPEPTPKANNFTIGNLLVAYPNGAEVHEDDGGFKLLLAGEDVAMYFHCAMSVDVASSRDAIEAGKLNEMVQNSLEQQAYEIELIDAPQAIPLLETHAVYAFYEATQDDATKLAKFYLFSDGMYDYTITSAIREQHHAEYDPWVEQIIERITWTNPPLPPDWRGYMDDSLSFAYPTRFVEWSARTKDSPAIMKALKKADPQNKQEDWDRIADGFTAVFYDGEASIKPFAPRFNLRLEAVLEASNEILHDAAVRQAMKDEIEEMYPGIVWYQDLQIEQHGEMEFLTMLGEADDNGKFVIYEAAHVWNERMLVLVWMIPPELMNDTWIAEVEAVLASVRIK